MGFQLRILFSMLLLMLLSLVGTISVAWKFAAQKDQEYNNQRLLRKELAVERSMDYVLDRMPSAFHTDEIPLVFSDRICELADVHGLVIRLYSPEGKLLTQSSFAENEASMIFLSDPILRHLKENRGEVERIDLGPVVLAHWYFENQNDDLVGIAQVRYEKRSVETGDFKSFLTQLAPLYVLLILGGALIAALLSNRLVRILTIIRDRMRKLDPTQEQVPIPYDQTDAIGELVAEYNDLLSHLQKTVEELAIKEREGAWRLMAMQVAHEIKNPLTPIKLGVQQLERAWKDERPDFGERLEHFCKVAAIQIDVLSEISTDFSLIADLGVQGLEKVELSSLLEEVVGLFQMGSLGVRWEISGFDEGVSVRGSRSHLLRVFNNLITNSIQALSEKPNKTIRVDCKTSGQGWEIIVEDNGVGISETQVEHVFQPHFTLKKEGSGLGLTLTRSVIQQLGGSIKVSKKHPGWTTFIIWLPKA
jgi:signal transduction histidine kinase